jgi:putative heme transporter
MVLWFFILPLIPGVLPGGARSARGRPPAAVVGVGARDDRDLLLRAADPGGVGRGGSKGCRWRGCTASSCRRRAMANVVPGGSAAGFGAGLPPHDGVGGAGSRCRVRPVATAGIGSAVVLNLLLWLGLVISIPLRGVNALYGAAALVGILLMVIAARLGAGHHGRSGALREGGAVAWRGQTQPQRGPFGIAGAAASGGAPEPN